MAEEDWCLFVPVLLLMSLNFSVLIQFDGELLAFGSYDGLVTVWSLVEESELFTLQGHERSVRATLAWMKIHRGFRVRLLEALVTAGHWSCLVPRRSKPGIVFCR